MAIICDVCGEDVTPGKHDFFGSEDNMRFYDIIKVNGRNVCACMDCYIAIGEWLTSQECTEYCKKHKQEVEG